MAIELFNSNYYRANNSDLASFNDAQALSHFQTSGLDEGRTFSPFVGIVKLNYLNNNQPPSS